MSVQIQILAVGRIKESFIREGLAEYEKRLRPYVTLRITEISEEKRQPSVSGTSGVRAVEKEGERILAAIPGDAFIISLDRTGERWTSEDLATFLGSLQLTGQHRVFFVIGGDLGLSGPVLARSSRLLSLSAMTFTHPLARLVLLEQIYRAFRIMHGEPYHK